MEISSAFPEVGQRRICSFLGLVLDDKPWVFDSPYFVVLNLALGGNYPYSRNGVDAADGACFGLPEATIEALPQHVEVDWVRVCTRAD